MGRRLVVAGRPPSGGSGCHLWWEGMPADRVVAVAATLEVLEAPTAPRLYFWALQATFTGPSGPLGAAHTGLQWNPRFPGSRAVNWGGYHHPTAELRQLPGTESRLPGIETDPNTRAYRWEPGRAYQFVIRRGGQGWVATVTDHTTGEHTVVRELLVGGDRLTGAVVWAELFCHCDDPRSVVRWSGFWAATPDGRWVAPEAVRVNIPAPGSGNCDNLDVRADGAGGFLVITNTERQAPDSARHLL